MKKNSVLFIFLCLSTLLEAIEKKDWTYLVYIAGDNSLEPFIDSDLKEMKRVGSNEHINVLAYVNTKRPNQEKTTEKFIVYYHDQERDGAVESLDSGTEETLMDSLVWAHTKFPSNHFALILWDHGSGPLNRNKLFNLRGVCYDDTTGNYLTDRNVYNVLEQFCTHYRDGKKIDIIAFDACLMGHLEIAFTVQPWADYMVASQENIPGNGNEYYQVLKPFKYGTIKPEIFARRMVYAFEKCYKNSTQWQSFTLSALNLSMIDPLVQALDRVAQLLNRYLDKENNFQVSTALQRASSPEWCPHFNEHSYLDLYSWCLSVLHSINRMGLKETQIKKLSTALETTIKACSLCILSETHGSEHPNVHGLSIYFPKKNIDSSYPTLYWSERTRWLSFIKNYNNRIDQNS